VTVLGCHRSIGDQHNGFAEGLARPLSRRGFDGAYQCAALAKLAKEFGARFAAIADPNRLAELKEALAGTRIECGAARAR